MSIERARRVLLTEARAISELADRIDDSFVRAVEIMLACSGKVIVAGIGKSGLVGRKIAATLASTGTPAFFIHPAEGVHGDVGMVGENDIVLLLSNSGETEELISLVPAFKRLGLPVIGLLGNKSSRLARSADIVIDVSVSEEACPLKLAPTASTTATMAMGDALALTLLQRRGFTEEDFARLHPSGTLGKKLLLRVSDLMHTGEKLPLVKTGTPFKDLVYEMSSKMLGHAIVADGDKVLGIISDGDIRRAFEKEKDLMSLTAQDIMSRGPKWMRPDNLAEEALRKMEKNSITSLVVCSDDKGEKLAGIIHLHDLLRAGVV
ncbi:MAG: KpsF/GutQ family sugar-phosphate isomerase [bacterium]